MNLFVSDIHKSFNDLIKAEGEPPKPPKQETMPTKVSPIARTAPALPKIPGAASGTSGPQIVDCPLGLECPDGGKHEAGSKKLIEHTQQAAHMGQMGQHPLDESKGANTGKPGVMPGSQNIGSLGSDQAKTRTVDQDREMPGGGHNTNAPDDRKTMVEGVAQHAQENPGYENPASQRMTLHDKETNLDRPKRQEVPNPLMADPSSVPASSKPMDHYRLAKVSKESGDEETAKFHENMAKQRSSKLGSDEHLELANNLHNEGMPEHANYHENIHSRVKGQQVKEEPKEIKNFSKVHKQGATKATNELEAAKKQHEALKSKAEKIKQKNEQAVKAHEEALKEHSEAKTAGSKAKPPKKPKLEKEPKVPEKPDLAEPESEGEMLRHENHTTRAKRTADMIESHLNNNPNLSDTEKERLTRAHKMAAFHSNIPYTPTAEHRKELGDVERAASDMGVKEHWDKVQEKENTKATVTASKQAAKDQKEQVKNTPKTPEEMQASRGPADDARIADHVDRAKQLKAKILSHLEKNPNLSPEEQSKAQSILQELDKHEKTSLVPTKQHSADLKELHGLAGNMGKKEYTPETQGASGGSSGGKDSSGSLISQFQAGRAAGAGLAASATSPYGAAGHIGPQVVNYGISGATSAGHLLLKDSDKDDKAQEGVDKEKARQEQFGRGSQ